MKLHWSPRSPFVRKVMIVAHELGLVDRITCVRTVAATTKPHAVLMDDNPLSKIPTLVLDDGTVLYDSRVICEYLDGLHGGNTFFPAEHARRAWWRCAGRRWAMAVSISCSCCATSASARNRPRRISRPTRPRSTACSRRSTQEAGDLAATPFNIGHVAIGTALSYLDFRYADEDWRTPHPRIARWHEDFRARPSVRATEPVDDS